jgi:hypothetical protein
MKHPQLKHIASYLPFKVNMQTITKGSFIPDPPIKKIEVVTLGNASNLLNKRYRVIECKLVLRPIKDLIKVIQYDKGKYCILSLWYSLSVEDEENFDLRGIVPDYWKSVIKNIELNGFSFIDHGFMDILHEHHYDTKEFITNDFAVNYNSIKH